MIEFVDATLFDSQVKESLEGKRASLSSRPNAHGFREGLESELYSQVASTWAEFYLTLAVGARGNWG